MILARRECKDNNAVYVKRIMPERPPGLLRQQTCLCIMNSIDIERGSQKELDSYTSMEHNYIYRHSRLASRRWPTETPNSGRSSNRER